MLEVQYTRQQKVVSRGLAVKILTVTSSGVPISSKKAVLGKVFAN